MSPAARVLPCWRQYHRRRLILISCCTRSLLLHSVTRHNAIVVVIAVNARALVPSNRWTELPALTFSLCRFRSETLHAECREEGRQRFETNFQSTVVVVVAFSFWSASLPKALSHFFVDTHSPDTQFYADFAVCCPVGILNLSRLNQCTRLHCSRLGFRFSFSFLSCLFAIRLVSL